MDNVDFNYFLESPKGRCLEKHIRANFPDLYMALQHIPGTKYSEKIYRYYNQDVENKCVVCGRPTKFQSITHGFFRTCCIKCAAKDPQRNSKAKQTCIERYGVENPSQSDTIKRKKEETCLQNYGVTNPNKSKSVHTKTCATKHQRYGDPNYNNRSKATQTMMDRYGVRNAFNMPGIFEAGLQKRLDNDSYSIIAQKSIERYMKTHPDVISMSHGDMVCTCPDPSCNLCADRQYNITYGNYTYRSRCGAEKCTIKNPVGSTNSNTSLERFVESILSEHNIHYIKHDRSTLGHRELDFYIPELRLAIECNGCYWHSDAFKTKQYHYKKFIDCLELGIQLITLWEDQIQSNPDVVTNLLLSKLNIYKHAIGARKCIIKRIASAEASTILKWHIQGTGQASVRFGLYYNDELVSVMTFSKSRKIYGGVNSGGEWELVRYCCAPGVRIVGGAGKLLKHAISHIKPAKIISFSSNDISTGELYKSLKFAKKSVSQSYWYIEPNKLIRHHRYVYRKSELVAAGADPTKSEFEITNEMGLYRIWDCGQTRWELII